MADLSFDALTRYDSVNEYDINPRAPGDILKRQ
jgi:hypothetical protein